MTDSAVQTAPKKERSPNFPFIPLTKAIDRTRELFTAAKRHEVRSQDVANAWGLGAKSSTTLQTIGALNAYGLLEDSGSGENKKFKVSELGWKILEDSRPGAKETALRDAALKPKWIAEYAGRWKDGRPADSICISELKFDHGFTDDAAVNFLKVFDGTIQFAKPQSGDNLADKKGGTDELRETKVDDPPKVKIGDYVQWTSGDVDQFKVPRRIVGFFDDTHAQVFGSNTGILVSELTVTEPVADVVPAIRASVEANSAMVQGENDFSVLQRGNRLQITADVDLEGISLLKDMLKDYESILQRLVGKKTT